MNTLQKTITSTYFKSSLSLLGIGYLGPRQINTQSESYLEIEQQQKRINGISDTILQNLENYEAEQDRLEHTVHNNQVKHKFYLQIFSLFGMLLGVIIYERKEMLEGIIERLETSTKEFSEPLYKIEDTERTMSEVLSSQHRKIQ